MSVGVNFQLFIAVRLVHHHQTIKAVVLKTKLGKLSNFSYDLEVPIFDFFHFEF